MHVLIEGKQNLGQRPFRLIIQGIGKAGRLLCCFISFPLLTKPFSAANVTTLTSTVDDHIMDATAADESYT